MAGSKGGHTPRMARGAATRTAMQKIKVSRKTPRGIKCMIHEPAFLRRYKYLLNRTIC